MLQLPRRYLFMNCITSMKSVPETAAMHRALGTPNHQHCENRSHLHLSLNLQVGTRNQNNVNIARLSE
jgi:hypothetical protein